MYIPKPCGSCQKKKTIYVYPYIVQEGVRCLNIISSTKYYVGMNRYIKAKGINRYIKRKSQVFPNPAYSRYMEAYPSPLDVRFSSESHTLFVFRSFSPNPSTPTII